MKNRRPDHYGSEESIYRKNKAFLKKTCDVCAICGRPIDKSLKFPDNYSFTADHIIPVQKGGRSTLDNLQPAHLICNKKKGTKIIAENESLSPPKKLSLPQYFDWASYSAD